jgi:hypothetical protein
MMEDRTAVTVLGRNPPTDEEWEVVCAFCRGANPPVRVLVLSAGGAPTPAQRHAILDASGGKGLPQAILTESHIVRGIVTAISWFVKGVRAFAPSDLQAALDHLRITKPMGEMQAVLDELKRELEIVNKQSKIG